MDRDDPLMRREKNVHDHGLESYGELFSKADEKGSPVLMEATPHYLYQKTALDVLSTMDPQPHVIILLRNPTDRIQSSFRYTKFNLGLVPSKLTFDEYVNGLLTNSESLTEQLRNLPVLRCELEFSNYVDFLAAWHEKFDASRFHVFLFEEFIQSPMDSLKSLAERLELEPSFYNDYDFSRVNESIPMRRAGLNWRALQIAKLIPKGKLKAALKGIYVRFQGRKPTAKTEMTCSSTSLERLDEYFQSANSKLAELLQKDLSVWNKSR